MAPASIGRRPLLAGVLAFLPAAAGAVVPKQVDRIVFFQTGPSNVAFRPFWLNLGPPPQPPGAPRFQLFDFSPCAAHGDVRLKYFAAAGLFARVLSCVQVSRRPMSEALLAQRARQLNIPVIVAGLYERDAAVEAYALDRRQFHFIMNMIYGRA